MAAEAWTQESLKIAFDRFIAENGRLPTAPETDRTDYLPSARQIQRRFGGLKELRAALGYEDTDFGSGTHRSNMATNGNLRASEAERELQHQLASIFGEPYVHSEKYYGGGRNRADFIVYTKDAIFGIDVFTTETKHDLQKNVAIKIDKYIDFPQSQPLYFVVVSKSLSESDVKLAVAGMTKISKLPSVKVLTPEGLFEDVEQYERYLDPDGFKSLYELS
ncbi:MAG TPA: hypothetical protein VHD60_02605 [Candidatus Saccharimonadales bacterium]|nr:hypothetical protein [Candidatus Saccharimonadales bacterium]